MKCCFKLETINGGGILSREQALWNRGVGKAAGRTKAKSEDGGEKGILGWGDHPNNRNSLWTEQPQRRNKCRIHSEDPAQPGQMRQNTEEANTASEAMKLFLWPGLCSHTAPWNDAGKMAVSSVKQERRLAGRSSKIAILNRQIITILRHRTWLMEKKSYP